MQCRTITGNVCVSAMCKKHDYEWNCHELLDHYVNQCEERSLDNAAVIEKPSAVPGRCVKVHQDSKVLRGINDGLI